MDLTHLNLQQIVEAAAIVYAILKGIERHAARMEVGLRHVTQRLAQHERRDDQRFEYVRRRLEGHRSGRRRRRGRHDAW